LLIVAGQLLQTIIATALEHIEGAQTTSLQLANLEVLINAILYNPSAGLHLMESSRPGSARAFFDQWFSAINAENKLPRVHDKKLSIVALCALLELNPTAIPEQLKDGWPGLVAGALTLFRDLPKAMAARKELEEAFQESEEEEEDVDDDAFLNLEEDGEDVWDEDSQYLEVLAKAGQRLRAKSEGKEVEGGDDDDDDDDDDDIQEELGYFCPLDNVDPYVSFKNALTAFQMLNVAGYQTATTSLKAEQQTLLMEVMRIAETQSENSGSLAQA